MKQTINFGVYNDIISSSYNRFEWVNKESWQQTLLNYSVVFVSSMDGRVIRSYVYVRVGGLAISWACVQGGCHLTMEKQVQKSGFSLIVVWLGYETVL